MSIVLLIALLIYPTLFTTKVVGIGVDLYGTVWFYDWVRISMESGELSGFTDWFFYPDGKDIFSHTGSNIIDAILSIPFQWVLGDRYFGVFIAFLMMLNVIALRNALRVFQVSKFAMYITSIVWVLNPFVLSELNMGRPTQILLFPSFMGLAVWKRMLITDEDCFYDKVLLGMLVALQGWCYWFYGIFLVLFLIMYSLIDSQGSLTRIRNMLGKVWIPVLVCLLLISPALIAMVDSVQQGPVPGVMTFSGLSMQEMSSQIVPWIRGYHIHDPVGHPLMRTSLSGLMLVCIVMSRRISTPIVAASGFLWMVGLGPWLPFGDTQYVNWFYLTMMKSIPFFERLWFPYRAMSFVLMGFSISFGLGISVLLQRCTLLKKVGLLTGVISLGLLDLMYVHSLPLTHTETKPSSVIECIDGPYIELPIGFAHPSMMWQGKIQQPTFGGMGENGLTFLPKGYLNRLQNPFIATLKSKSLIVKSTKVFTPFDKERIVSDGFEYVLWDRSITEQERMKRRDGSERPNEVFEIQDHLMEILGYPICEDAQYLVFTLKNMNVPPSKVFNDEWTWALPLQSTYEERLRELGRVPD